MKQYDVIIVGGATSGSYFAKLLAEKGHKVLIIEKNAKSKVGSKYDIFHMPKKDFEHFNVPLPKKGDKEWGCAEEAVITNFINTAPLTAVFGDYPLCLKLLT